MQKIFHTSFFALGFGACLATAAMAQTAYEAEPQDATGKFTTATEIKMILPHTKAQWVAVRLYEGRDLLYFTNLLAWRCGMHEIRYGVNGGEMRALEMEPCYIDEGAPNALKIDGGIFPYVTLEPESVESVEIEILFDDMSEDGSAYQRSAIQIN